MLYVNAADADAAPHLFKRVTAPQAMSNGVILQPQYQPIANWQDVVKTVYGGGVQPVEAPPAPIEYKPNVPGRSKSQIIQKAQGWTKVEGSDA